MYEFNKQLSIGNIHEQALDNYFRDNGYQVIGVSQAEQFHGIDRIFQDLEDGRTLTVEYKVDLLTDKTGNVFIETISNDKKHKPGWALSSWAQILCYLTPLTGELGKKYYVLYWCYMPELKTWLKPWSKTFPKAGPVENRGYNGWGIAVPEDELGQLAKRLAIPDKYFTSLGLPQATSEACRKELLGENPKPQTEQG